MEIEANEENLERRTAASRPLPATILPAFCPYPALPSPINVRLVTLPTHDCAYLPGRPATARGFYAGDLSPDEYHDLMDAGFRRSGRIVYQPICRGCRACVPIRVLVDQFQPSKSHRRCTRRNADLTITEGSPSPTDEKFHLYQRYISQWHGKPSDNPEDDRESFEAFLYDSPINTLEFNYRDVSGKLLAVGLCDFCNRSLSSVYFFFDPSQSKRGLGTLGVIHELLWSKKACVPYYYLGYWVTGCSTMQYKRRFGPNEFLSPQGSWGALQE